MWSADGRLWAVQARGERREVTMYQRKYEISVRHVRRCSAAKEAGEIVNNNENTSARPTAMRKVMGGKDRTRWNDCGKTWRAG